MSMTAEGMTILKTKVDDHLKDTALVQYLFKPGPVQAVAVAIGKAFDAGDADHPLVWSDEIVLPELGPDDRNVIGTAYKQLARWGIIRRLEGQADHRRSKAAGRRGGVVWRYRLLDRRLLRAFLKNNGQPVAAKKYEQQTLI